MTWFYFFACWWWRAGHLITKKWKLHPTYEWTNRVCGRKREVEVEYLIGIVHYELLIHCIEFR